jgi:hypothetical protein
LGLSEIAARIYLGQAVELRDRLPRLWVRVMAGEVPAWKARQLSFGPMMRAVEAAELRFDPDAATERARRAAEKRGCGWRTGSTEPRSLDRSGVDAASFPVRKDAVMPKKFDAATKERACKLIAAQAAEVGSVTKACEVVSGKLGIGKETLRGWARQAQIDAGNRAGATTE